MGVGWRPETPAAGRCPLARLARTGKATEGAAQFWNNKPWRIWVCTGLEQEAMAAKVEDDGVVFFLLIDFQQLKNLCGGVNLLCSQGKS
ncbi:hypothetical protein ACQJBY_056745 [Aegilops geniculata]